MSSINTRIIPLIQPLNYSVGVRFETVRQIKDRLNFAVFGGVKIQKHKEVELTLTQELRDSPLLAKHVLGQVVAPQVESGQLHEPLLRHQGRKIGWGSGLALHKPGGGCGNCIRCCWRTHHCGCGTAADSEHGWTQIHRGRYVGWHSWSETANRGQNKGVRTVVYRISRSPTGPLRKCSGSGERDRE